MPTKLPVKAVDRLFIRMQSTYGHLWSSRFSDADMLSVAKNEWAIDLGRFSLDEIGKAIEKCKKQYMTPPTLPQFIELCKAAKEARFYKALPKPKQDPEKVKAHIKEMRSKLSKS